MCLSIFEYMACLFTHLWGVAHLLQCRFAQGNDGDAESSHKICLVETQQFAKDDSPSRSSKSAKVVKGDPRISKEHLQAASSPRMHFCAVKPDSEPQMR